MPTTPRGIKVRVCQLLVEPGRPANNLARMLGELDRARDAGDQLVVFPEMAIPGYLLGDEWERPAFLRECERKGDQLIAASQGLTVIFGNVAIDRERCNEDGRVRKYNALFVAEDGKPRPPRDAALPWVVKTLMPNYRQFDDSRHFFDLRKLAHERGVTLASLVRPVETRCGVIGGVLCEDGWDIDYAHAPLKILADQGTDLFVNISASPFTFNKNHKRSRVFNSAACRYGKPLVYANQVSLQNNGKTIFTFDGASCIYDGQGNRVALGKPYEISPLRTTIPLDGSPFGKPVTPDINDMAHLRAALEFGARTFMQQIGVERVTIGASGGIDSALCAALYSRVLPPENLLLVNMPSRYNSETTKSLARQLADNLGVRYTTIPIEASVELTARQVNGLDIALSPDDPIAPLQLSSFMLENVQARDRSSRVLSTVSNAFGSVFTCNANKSELTVGYGTLYGDICGFLALLADLWKTEIWQLARHMNATIYGSEVIPTGSIELVPSAELSADQDVDSGRGDPLVYPYHDKVFASWVERWDRATPEELLDWYLAGTLESEIGYDGKVEDLFATPEAFITDVERWWNLYQGMALAKRIQAPPVMAVKRRAFGFDHRESQLGPRYTERYARLRDRMLARR